LTESRLDTMEVYAHLPSLIAGAPFDKSGPVYIKK
jgi:hypothetical protein